MKMHCRSCGCHFDDDFEETLKPECTMWRDRGFADDMSEAHKRAVFNAFFSVPVDEIADETGVVTHIDIKATPGMTYTTNQFEEMVPGYRYMTDRERRDFQKRYFKHYYNQDPAARMLRDLDAMGELDSLHELQFQGEQGRLPCEDSSDE